MYGYFDIRYVCDGDDVYGCGDVCDCDDDVYNYVCVYFLVSCVCCVRYVRIFRMWC